MLDNKSANLSVCLLMAFVLNCFILLERVFKRCGEDCLRKVCLHLGVFDFGDVESQCSNEGAFFQSSGILTT